MNTPVLTAIQQKKTLSARKKSKKITIKNILASPYGNYWPLLKSEEATSLIEVLNKHLVKIKQPKINVPWHDLKNVPRENRKAFRLNYTKDNSESEEKNCKSAIVFGVNETTKLLETNTASSVLISGDVNPQFMVKHVLDQAVLKNTPILIVSNLKNILKEKTGISSLAVAFKASNMDSNYWAIDQKIKEIHSNYPVPSNHINFLRKESAGDDKSQIWPKTSPMDLNEEKAEPPRNVYLYRKSKSQRMFVPESSQECNAANSVTKMELDSSGFLGFDDKSSSSKKRKAPLMKAKVSYKSLVIKRVTNNQDRHKKKIEMLKGNK